ncbi:MAG TPA: ABC transporter permease [Gemmatimonadaceae bacterium]|jgi:peptide/nickel transport system permease protein|nr:ABC transporter permease [Gemmatimonadaceae bacterium]
MSSSRVAAWVLCTVLTVALCRWLERAGARAGDDAGPWRRALARFHHDRVAMVALWLVVAASMVAALAPWLAPYSPTATPDIVELKNLPPSFAHFMGTDFASRDVFSRLLYGARVSLSIALLAILLSATVGTLYGAAAGYYGGRVDAVMMRIIDAALSVPRILLLITLLVLWGAVPVAALIVVLGFTGWFGVSRLVRAEVLALKERDMVVAARALGARDRDIILRHILPNVVSPVVVAATLGIANVIVIEAGLSYLGIGVRPPLPSWGNMIQDGVSQIATVWWVSLFPGLAIVATVMAFNIIGDGLRDALDPRQLDG